MIVKLFDDIAAALNEDEEIQDFCVENFDKKQHVFVGQNPEKPCTKESMPAIIIGGLDGGKSNDTTREKRISIGIFVANESDSETDDEGITRYAGLYQCEELAELVGLCLLKMHYKSSIEHVAFPSDKFPIFSANIIFIVEKISPIRGVNKG